MAAGAEQHGAGGGGGEVPLPLPLGELTCPWCGSAVDEDALQCPACTGPLRVDEPVEGEPESDLPPLPDGGLAALMPTWLLDEPDAPAEPSGATPTAAAPPPGGADTPPVVGPGPAAWPSDALRPRAPVASEPLLTEADLPAWLLALAARGGAGPEPVAEADGVAAGATAGARTEPLFLPDARARATASDVTVTDRAALPRGDAVPTRRDGAARAAAEPVSAHPEPGPARPEPGWVAVAVLFALLVAFAAVAVAAGVWEVPFRR